MDDMISRAAAAMGNIFGGGTLGYVSKRRVNSFVAGRVLGIPAASPDKCMEQRRKVR